MNGPRTTYDRAQPGPSSPEVNSDQEINGGYAPHGVYRDFWPNAYGVIGDDVNTFPTDGGWLFIPHHAVIRKIPDHIGISGRTMDDAAYIPSFAVGDPR